MTMLRVVTASILFAGTAAWASASEETSVPTFTVTAKRHPAALAVEHVPPQAAVEIATLSTANMPEALIEYRLSPIGVSPAPAGERITL